VGGGADVIDVSTAGWPDEAELAPAESAVMWTSGQERLKGVTEMQNEMLIMRSTVSCTDAYTQYQHTYFTKSCTRVGLCIRNACNKSIKRQLPRCHFSRCNFTHHSEMRLVPAVQRTHLHPRGPPSWAGSAASPALHPPTACR